jgi:hypothetical protein
MANYIGENMPPEGYDIDPISRQLEDPNYSPSIEECMYWAEKEREHEKEMSRRHGDSDEAGHYGSLFKKLFRSNSNNATQTGNNAVGSSDDRASSEKEDEKIHGDGVVTVTSAEREQAYRAFRTAGWISVFYLITTDILGPYSAPWAFAQLGKFKFPFDFALWLIRGIQAM